jgi:type II secretory pathway pseudopilin PulG
MSWTSNEIAIVTVAGTVIVAILSSLAIYFASKRQDRREIYSKAVQAIVGWREMLYRVRRRVAGQETDLVKSFHSLQEQLDYYEAWVGSESKYMSRSYVKLVKDVKGKTEKLITEAWTQPIRPAPGNASKGDSHPDIQAALDRFLMDVRSHLSPLPWRKIAIVYRNKKVRK